MRVTVYGLTDSTIVFNKIGLTLRGNSNDLDQYPNSIARHVLIDTIDKEQELNYVANSGQIKFVNEDVVKQEKKPTISPNVSSSVISMLKQKEEMPGLPPPEESEVVVATESGSIKTKIKNNMSPPEDESVQESLDAMKKLEEEEKEAMQPENEEKESKPKKKIDPSDEMGQDVVISTGGTNTIKKPMQHSVVGEINIEPFIDKIDDEKTKAEEENIKQAFIIDENAKDDDDKHSDAFIEA